MRCLSDARGSSFGGDGGRCPWRGSMVCTAVAAVPGSRLFPGCRGYVDLCGGRAAPLRSRALALMRRFGRGCPRAFPPFMEALMRPLRQPGGWAARDVAGSRSPAPLLPRACAPATAWAGARVACGFAASRAPNFGAQHSAAAHCCPSSQQRHIAAPPQRWRRSRRRRRPRHRTKAAKAEAKEDPNRLPSFIPRTGLVFSERTAFAPVLCPPKLLPIRPYHVQRGQAQDSDDDDEAPPPKEGEEKKSESTTDVYDKRYLAEKKLVGDWGREPVVDEGYDPSRRPLELVQKPAAEPAAASSGCVPHSFVCARRSDWCEIRGIAASVR